MAAERKKRPAPKTPGRFLVYGQVYLTIQINAFLYYLSRLPILGKMIHSDWYGQYRIKRVWSLFGLAFGFIQSALANNIGTLVMLYVIPHLILKEEMVTEGVFLMLFILAKCVGAAIIECGLFKTSAEDYTFLNHFMVNPVSYYRYKAAKNAFFSGVMLFPAIYFLFRDWKMTAALVTFKTFCVLFGNVIYLKTYKRYGHLPGKRIRRILAYAVILGSYGGALLGWYRNAGLPLAWQLTVGTGSAVLAVFCWIYHLHYSDYRKIAVKFADQSVASLQISIHSSSVGEDENGLLESGWKENREFFRIHQEDTPEKYLDLAFLGRFGKALRKERRDRVLVMLAAGIVLGLGIRFGWLPVTADTALDYSPVLIAFASSMAFADRLMQIYFRNIDMHMLYHHMANPKFIRNSMLRRYLYLLKWDLLSAAAIAGNLLLILFLSGLALPWYTAAELTAVCIVFLIFWETYQCIVYYLLQPYSADLTAKSPVFKALGYLEGIFNLLVLFVRRDLTATLPWVCAACAAAVVLFFVSRKFAPRTFRLR